MTREESGAFLHHPVDTPLSAASRFAVELAAWVFATWAASRLSPVTGIITLVVLVALPATLNTPGDKKVTGVPVSGRVRLAIELALYLVAALAPWLVLAPFGAAVVTLLVLAAGPVQLRRWRWLVYHGVEAS